MNEPQNEADNKTLSNPVSKVGKTIHPTTDLQAEVTAKKPPVLPIHEIYPEASKEPEIHPSGYTADQHFALHNVAREAELAHKTISQRVKTLFVIGGLLALSSIFGMGAAISQELNAAAFIAFALYGVQLVLAVYLLTSKDIHGVALWLKVILVFQILGTISSLINPLLFILRLITLGVVLYAYGRVKNLSRLH